MQTNTPRPAKMTILLGTNGTGKTTLLRSIIESLHQRVLIITPDDAEWQHLPDNPLATKQDFIYSGMQRHIFDPNKKTGTLSKIHLFKKGIIIFDDCRAYLQASTSEEVRMLLIRRRQREVDIFAVGHGFTEVPPVFFTFATDIFLFRTTDEIARRKNCLKDYENIRAAQARVNDEACANPHYFAYIKYN